MEMSYVYNIFTCVRETVYFLYIILLNEFNDVNQLLEIFTKPKYIRKYYIEKIYRQIHA